MNITRLRIPHCRIAGFERTGYRVLCTSSHSEVWYSVMDRLWFDLSNLGNQYDSAPNLLLTEPDINRTDLKCSKSEIEACILLGRSFLTLLWAYWTCRPRAIDAHFRCRYHAEAIMLGSALRCPSPVLATLASPHIPTKSTDPSPQFFYFRHWKHNLHTPRWWNFVSARHRLRLPLLLPRKPTRRTLLLPTRRWSLHSKIRLLRKR